MPCTKRQKKSSCITCQHFFLHACCRSDGAGERASSSQLSLIASPFRVLRFVLVLRSADAVPPCGREMCNAAGTFSRMRVAFGSDLFSLFEWCNRFLVAPSYGHANASCDCLFLACFDCLWLRQPRLVRVCVHGDCECERFSIASPNFMFDEYNCSSNRVNSCSLFFPFPEPIYCNSISTYAVVGIAACVRSA